MTSIPILIAAALSLTGTAPAPSASTATPLVIGVTLHPYSSWVSQIVAGTDARVHNVIPGSVDAGAYQPRPEDIARIATFDVLVENGLGHDGFIDGMIRSARVTGLRRINVNAETTTLTSAHGEAVNSHTFISLTNAIQQTNLLARVLGEQRPADAKRFSRNAAAYTARLRGMLAKAQAALAQPGRPKRVVTVHDGYSYLLGELGIDLVGVVEPAHGLTPSAQEMGAMIDLLKREHIEVVLSEASFPPSLLAPLEAAGARVFVVSHVATGAYTPEKFEVEMQKNLDTIVGALMGP